MTVTLFVVAAAAGAAGRHLLGRLEPGWAAVLVANTAGSLVLGLLLAAEPGGRAEVVLGLGLCGSLTTYSSFAREARLLGVRRGTAYAAVTVTLAIAAVTVP